MAEDDEPTSLKSLEERLAKARRAERRPDAKEPEPSSLGIAMRIGLELVVGVVVGAGLGLFLDRWLGTAPWLMILFFFFGTAAGFMNVIRNAGPAGPGPDKDDEDLNDRGS